MEEHMKIDRDSFGTNHAKYCRKKFACKNGHKKNQTAVKEKEKPNIFPPN